MSPFSPLCPCVSINIVSAGDKITKSQSKHIDNDHYHSKLNYAHYLHRVWGSGH